MTTAEFIELEADVIDAEGMLSMAVLAMGSALDGLDDGASRQDRRDAVSVLCGVLSTVIGVRDSLRARMDAMEAKADGTEA